MNFEDIIKSSVFVDRYSPLTKALVLAWIRDVEKLDSLRGQWHTPEPPRRSRPCQYVQMTAKSAPPSLVANLPGRLEIELDIVQVSSLEFNDDQKMYNEAHHSFGEKVRILLPSQVLQCAADDNGRELMQYLIQEGYYRNW